ncbi:MAG: hypothetical protein ACHQ1D_00405 [Nitrososphaerales archaeon]
MKLYHQKNLWRVVEKWKESYPKTKKDIYKELTALSPGSTSQDIRKIIGNDSWTSTLCGECKTPTDTWIEIGDEPCYESQTAYLCPECILKAGELVG